MRSVGGTLATETPHDATIRHDMRPGDLGRVIEQHAELYAAEFGFDRRFEAYVAETLGEFGRLFRPHLDRLWLAERDGRLLGSIGVIGRDDNAAQIRWVLLDPAARGTGLGRRLLDTALAFCREADYTSIFLWTVEGLAASARLYVSAGFRKTETKPATVLWGATLCEERYDLAL